MDRTRRQLLQAAFAVASTAAMPKDGGCLDLPPFTGVYSYDISTSRSECWIYGAGFARKLEPNETVVVADCGQSWEVVERIDKNG